MATDRDGFSLGSGTLVAVSEHHGLVVTNWHVIRDAAGPIGVALPNGFRSTASVLKSDRDWDLAALAIWRPNVDPVPVATQPPQPGEPLTIAGYGSGQYRTITGRCTQYVAPGFNQPFEMVELSAPARQGDSGGPIFNSRGELAGVLFGTGGGKTSGSYCGRVRIFLASVKDDFFRLRPNPALVAQAPAVNPAPSIPPPPSTAAVNPRGAAPIAPSAPAPVQPGQVAGIQRSSPPAAIRAGDAGWTAASPSPAVRAPAASTQNTPFLDWPVAGTTLWSDIKNYLAVIGVAAILFHALRFLVGGTFSQRGR
jgi:S1-C subfamily serine protease